MRGLSGILWGLAFVMVGTLMLLDKFDVLQFSFSEFIRDWWPLALVIVGLGMILDRGYHHKEKK